MNADPGRVRRMMAGMGWREDRRSPAARCADNILAIAKARGSVSPAQRHQLQAMGHMLAPEQRAACAELGVDLRQAADMGQEVAA